MITLLLLLNLGGAMSSEKNLSQELAYSDTGKNVKILQDSGFKVVGLAFKTGQKLEKHKTATPAFLFVHQGQIEFSMDGKTHNLEAGSFFNIPVNIEHELLAMKDSKAFLIK